MNAIVYDLAAYRARRQSLVSAWIRFWLACYGIRRTQ